MHIRCGVTIAETRKVPNEHVLDQFRIANDQSRSHEQIHTDDGSVSGSLMIVDAVVVIDDAALLAEYRTQVADERNARNVGDALLPLPECVGAPGQPENVGDKRAERCEYAI